jgi:hypothetical protein
MFLDKWQPGDALASLLFVVLVAGCGGGGGNGSPSTAGGNDPGGSSANAPPAIQGAPGSSVVASQLYSFQPSANDPNGDSLTFAATNLPAWASFDAATGRISGTPTSADVGAYSGITITVSDGRTSASLGPFSITVTEIAGGVATLSWMPPTQNVDGSALTNLAGYEIRYGRSSEDLSSVITLTNPSLSVYVVENLSSGTWYFAVAAVNSNGAMSDLSNIASKTIS